MNFVSATFLLFLILTYGVYWKLGTRQKQNLLLMIASYFFYGWWDPRFCFLMLASTLLDFTCARGIEHFQTKAVRKTFLVISLVCNFALLGFFKYFNFFQDSLVASLGAFGIELDYVSLNIILPVGISFYTFQTISYTIDVYRGQLKPTRSFVDYAVYVSFFPQLVAGPIERGSRMLPQVTSPRQYRHENVVMGLQQIVWGMFKKVAIASNLAPIVDQVFNDIPSRSGSEIWVASIGFAIQIYCDFSGYSDIAIGSARLFGIRLMRNFACPYFSQSLREFWRRWHISLSTWFRDYVFIPLGGSQVSTLRCSFNLLLVFVISGLWHGASWNFVIWGAIHGSLLILESRLGTNPNIKATDMPGGTSFFPGIRSLMRMSSLFSIVVLAWVFFRVPEFDQAVLAIQKMLCVWQWPNYSTFETATVFHVFCMPLALLTVEWFTRKYECPFFGLNQRSRILAYACCTLTIWITLLLKPGVVGEFIYFQF